MSQLRKNQLSNLNNSFVVLSDFQSELNMFNLPGSIKKKFKEEFPNIDLKFVNDTSFSEFEDYILVYWGTRFNNDYFKYLKNLK